MQKAETYLHLENLLRLLGGLKLESHLSCREENIKVEVFKNLIKLCFGLNIEECAQDKTNKYALKLFLGAMPHSTCVLWHYREDSKKVMLIKMFAKKL